MNWIDIVLIVLLVVFVAIGFWKGFIFSVLSLFSVFINFILSLFLTKPISSLFNGWGLETKLASAFASKISSIHTGFDTNMIGMNQEQINNHVSTTLSEGDFPFKSMFERMIDFSPEAVAHKTNLTLTDILSKSLGNFFSLVISFTVAFLLISLVLWLIGFISKKAKQVEGIRVVDRLLGVVFGLIRGAIAISTIFTVLAFFKEDGILQTVFEYIDSSTIGSWVYENMNTLVDKYLNFGEITQAAMDSVIK